MDSYKWISTKMYCKRKQFVKTHHCSNYDIRGHAETCVERYCESAKKDVSSLQSSATLCVEDHLSPPEDFELKGELL